MSEPVRLRILCLHGFRQSEAAFRTQTAGLRRALEPVAELDYLQAPNNSNDLYNPDNPYDPQNSNSPTNPSPSRCTQNDNPDHRYALITLMTHPLHATR
jgi:hypothetical protein